MQRVPISVVLFVLLSLLVGTGWAIYRYSPGSAVPPQKNTANNETSKQSPRFNTATTTAPTQTDPPTDSGSQTAALSPDAGKADTSNPSNSEDSSGKSSEKVPVDVALIEPGGTSVIAGSAKPNSEVIVSADGVEVATAMADANGDWVLTTDHPFASSSPKLEIAARDPVQAKAPPQQTNELEAKTPTARAPSQPAEKITQTNQPNSNQVSVVDRLTKEFENIVETARQNEQQEKQQKETSMDDDTAAPKAKDPPTAVAALSESASEVPPPETTPKAAPPAMSEAKTEQPAAEPEATQRIKPAADPAAKPGVQPQRDQVRVSRATPPTPRPVDTKPPPAQANPTQNATESNVATTDTAAPVKVARASPEKTVEIPIPIGFVYRTADFTDQGQKAVKLLSEYLAIKKPSSISLTGHADERGSRRLNMGLSKDRLDAVARALKNNGYTGELDLIARGEDEPFTGVDRSTLTKEERYALDRRVELKVRR